MGGFQALTKSTNVRNTTFYRKVPTTMDKIKYPGFTLSIIEILSQFGNAPKYSFGALHQWADIRKESSSSRM